MSDLNEDNRLCPHRVITEADYPPWDEEAARGLSSDEVHKRWPRGFVKCDQCGASMIIYASYAQYLMGDY